MVVRTYIEKMNTIVSGDTINTGINPISELVYGANTTRTLLYFNECNLRKLVDEKVFADISKLKHYLRITNASSIDFTQLHKKEVSSLSAADKIRACSFDLIFFLIPKFWDCGKGFDYSMSFFNNGYYNKSSIAIDSNRLVSRDGSNWYQARNGYYWEEEGVYSNETLSKEYDNFSSNKGSEIVIARQRFDIGNENINVDITEIVNKFISGELENYGIGIAFTPMLELSESKVDNYIGLVTNKTSTFFEPYLETVYEDYISDDRSHFALDKNNKLYLYCNINGKLENLDEMPTCHIQEKEYEVKQFSKGIYYIELNVSRSDFKPNTMLFDVWGNIVYQGVKYDDIELDFVLKSNSIFFNVGSSIENNNKLVPTVYGIKENEKILYRYRPWRYVYQGWCRR